MFSTKTLFKYLLTSIIILFSYSITSITYAGGVKIIINSGHYDRHYSGFDDSYRLRNKYYFDNRYRKKYRDPNYGKRYYRNKFYGNNYRYNKRNYYRSNRSYCPY